MVLAYWKVLQGLIIQSPSACHVTMDTRTQTDLALLPVVKYIGLKESHILYRPHNVLPRAYSKSVVL